MNFSMVALRSLELLNTPLIYFTMSSKAYTASSQLMPVMASMRLTPAATLLSLTILNIPMRPVLLA